MSVAFLSGCGGEDPKPSGTTAADTGISFGFDTGSVSDVGEDTDSCPGGAGCECSGNEDCDLAVCLATKDGSKCAAACTDSSSCESGQACTTVTTAGGDSPTVCVDAAVHLCDPCKSNSSCGAPGAAGAKCVQRGDDGSFCGVACGDGACPSGTTCQDVKDIEGKAVKQCMPADGAACTCSPLAIANELSTACGGEKGCAGVRACLADGKEGAPKGGGLSSCLGAKSSAKESCNGTDDDCDGQTDEDTTCDDDNACTIDACEAGKCSHTKNAAACDDGDACTENDSCATGTCVGTKKACDDNNTCTTDACDMKTGCSHAPAQTGSCDDGDVCTSDDKCTAGKCAGTAKDCDDNNACTADSCAAGTCTNKASTGSCDDGNPCTEGDLCGTDSGSGQVACLPGKTKSCDDSNPCTKDTCDKVLGCVGTVDVSITQPCYTAAPKTKGVGECTSGTQACKTGGGFGACTGEVVPALKEICNTLDDDCNGKTDDNCTGGGAPVLVWRLGSSTISGGNGSGVQARIFLGGDGFGSGPVAGASTTVEIGFYAWLASWLK
ncbi:MAG: hypothetical protein KC502_03970 [Myxococcales bacterium]|nr:hypothetical protein [Myxococcales bacterium]